MIIAYPSGSASSAYTIPSTVTGINVGAFTSSQFMTVVISDDADQAMLADSGLGSNVRVVTSSVYAEELIKAAAELKAKQEAEAKEAAEKLAAELKAAADLKAKQEAEAKEAAEKLAAELKAKQEEADAKAAADKLAAEKLAAELKAKQQAETKAAAAKAAALKKKTITCIKGKLTKKVTAVKPVCPAGYKKKA